MNKISILIADDHKIVRMGLKSLFAAEKDLAVVGEADDGGLTVSQALKLKPDVIIMDLMMPKKDGIAATAEICAKLPGTVAAGKKFISPEVKGLLAFDPPAPTLSPRQQEVLFSLVKGFNNTEIADQLGISRTVVKEHVETLLVKLGAANRTEAVGIALRKNLVKV